jgi:selenide,water dikinase
MKRLLLLGGGHSHLFVLESFLREPMAGAGLTLVSPVRLAPYSGMMPGVVAGHYAYEQGCVDLEPLCRAAGCKLRYTRAIALDPERRRVTCADGSTLQYDLLSINTGSAPGTLGVPGAAEHALPIKPIDLFVAHWRVFCTLLDAQRSARVVVVGGGAAGCEIALGLERHLRRLAERQEVGRIEITLVSASDSILPGFAPLVRKRVAAALARHGIQVLERSPAVHVEARAVQLSGGRRIDSDLTVWATGSGAPAWPRQSGLATDEPGFILTDRRLRSVSHGNVFASGDCASMVGRPHPRSGVYAVRAGPPLARNLRAALSGGRMRRYTPQRRSLALIGTGDDRAVAAWGPFGWEGEWIWRWKQRIDRAFVARFSLPAEPPADEPDALDRRDGGTDGSTRPPLRDERT